MALRPLDLLHLTYMSLKGNLLRSGLTALGVFMGVAAVNATLQVGEIGRAVVEQQLSEREAPQIYIYPDWGSENAQPFTVEDMEYLQRRMFDAPAIATSMNADYETELRFRERTAPSKVIAISADFMQTAGRKLLAGRMLNSTDFQRYRPVALIDRFLADQLFADIDPVGQKIYWRERPYFIVGVVESKLRYSGEEPSGLMLIPLSVYQAMTGWDRIWDISIRASDLDSMETTQNRAIALLEKRATDRTFNAYNNVEEIIAQKQTLQMVSRSLLAVGGIALLVGGVGIANITIASVMERTPEIGLRLAIGATKQEVMLQFILEAVVLSLMGGAIAIVTVHFATVAVAQTFDLPYEFSVETSVFSLGSAVFVGVGAGFLPAMKASELDPVKALQA